MFSKNMVQPSTNNKYMIQNLIYTFVDESCITHIESHN